MRPTLMRSQVPIELTIMGDDDIRLTTEDPMTTQPLTPKETLKTQKKVLFIEQSVLLLKIEFFLCGQGCLWS